MAVDMSRLTEVLTRYRELGIAEQLDYEKLYRLGYRGLVFDIDNTLVPHGADSTEEIDALFLSPLLDIPLHAVDGDRFRWNYIMVCDGTDLYPALFCMKNKFYRGITAV